MTNLRYEKCNPDPGEYALLTTFFILSLLTSPTPRDLLLDIQVQAKFVSDHSAGFLRVRYREPLAAELDPRFQPESVVLGTMVVTGGEARVLVPTHRVMGVKEATIELANGLMVQGLFEDPDKRSSEAPFTVLKPRKPDALKDVKALKWSDNGSSPEGLTLWAIEWPIGQQLPHSKAQPILVRTTLGDRVEPPLERFLYVPLGQADGLALLTHQGAVQCLIFRAVPGLKAKSLCAPQDAVLSPSKRGKQ